jgi:hypothetical protein
MPIPRLTHDAETLILRNDDDSEDASLVLKEIKLTGGTLEIGRILTSDAVGQGSWEINPAIESASAAQTAAEAAQATADAAIADAAAASAAAAAADAAAAAAGIAAAAANAIAVAAGAAATNAQTTADNAYPHVAQCYGDEFIYDTGSPFNTLDSDVAYNWYTFCDTDHAYAYHWMTLKAGTWDFHLMTILRENAGIVKVSIGSNLLATEDLYSVTLTPNEILTYTDVDIPTSANYALILETDGKNASSLGYVVSIIKFWGYRHA